MESWAQYVFFKSQTPNVRKSVQCVVCTHFPPYSLTFKQAIQSGRTHLEYHRATGCPQWHVHLRKQSGGAFNLFQGAPQSSNQIPNQHCKHMAQSLRIHNALLAQKRMVLGFSGQTWNQAGLQVAAASLYQTCQPLSYTLFRVEHGRHSITRMHKHTKEKKQTKGPTCMRVLATRAIYKHKEWHFYGE